MRGHVPLALFFLDRGANPDAMGAGYTPLHHAALVQQHVPVAVTVGGVPLTGITDVAAGWLYTCSRIADGTGRCWGANASGQTGKGPVSAAVTTPYPVPTLAGATATATGGAFSCALLALGAARCWGDNTSGQLGNATTTSSVAAVTVAFPTGIRPTALASGTGHSCAVVATGGVRCWGAGSSGQLGNGSTALSSVPVAVTGI